MEDIKEKLEVFKLPIGLILVGLVLITGGLIFTPKKTPDFPQESIVENKSKVFKVDISGEVANPGVYELEEGSRIEDLIKKAGGFTTNVNKEFISKNINLAQKIADAAKYYIPKEGEVVSSSTGFSGSAVAGVNTQVINVNTASQKELESLPGIGPVTAANIISNRPFSDVNDLLNKKVVSKATFEKIKATITAN